MGNEVVSMVIISRYSVLKYAGIQLCSFLPVVLFNQIKQLYLPMYTNFAIQIIIASIANDMMFNPMKSKPGL